MLKETARVRNASIDIFNKNTWFISFFSPNLIVVSVYLVNLTIEVRDYACQFARYRILTLFIIEL